MNNLSKKRKANVESDTKHNSSSKKVLEIKKIDLGDSQKSSNEIKDNLSCKNSNNLNESSFPVNNENSNEKQSNKMIHKSSLSPSEKNIENKKKETEKNIQNNSNKINPKFKQAKLEFFNIKVESKTPPLNLENLDKGRTIRIYSWNVNGIRATIEKGFFEYFIKEEDPDILCLNETKINLETLEKQKIDKIYKDKYTSYWNCSEEKNGYSGVCIFTKFKPIKVKNGMGIDKHDGEGKLLAYLGRLITMEFEHFYLLTVYTPNSGQSLKRLEYRTKEWEVDFRNYCKKLNETKSVIICGDLNVAPQEIDIHDPKGNIKSAGFTVEERNEFKNLLDIGFIDSYRKHHPDEKNYTYFSARFNSKESRKGWRIDFFLVSSDIEENVIDSSILEKYEGSDHVPIKLEYKV